MVLAATIAFLVALTFLYVAFVKWRQQYWARKGIPQMSPNVIFGDYMPMITASKSIQEFYLELYQRYKPAGFKHIGIYNTWYPEYVPLDPNQIKLILIKDFNHFDTHGMYHQKHDPFTMHLFNLEGEAWKARRTKLTPVFTTGKMKLMYDTLANKTTGLTQAVNRTIDTNEPLNIKDTLARFTTDVIGTVAFGLEIDTLKEPTHKFREIGKKTFEPSIKKFLVENFFSPYLLGKIGYHSLPADVESYFTQIVKDTIHYREKNGVERKDFIQLMIQLKNQETISTDNSTDATKKNNSAISEQEIINEAFLFYLAGFETTSSTMTFLFFELAQHPDIQEKLRQEILHVLEKYDGHVTYESLMEMDYLDKVFRETLRKYPVLSVLPRACTKDYKLANSDVVIKKGTRVHIPVIGIHMDPEYYPNPEQFNPENFNAENKAKRPDIAWIPFGEGPRQCIGLRFGFMQAKIGVVTLLKDFRFMFDKSMKPPYLIARGSLIYTFENDVLLRATRI